MKTCVRTVLAALLLLAAVPAFAQHGGGAPRRGEVEQAILHEGRRPFEVLLLHHAELDLTPSQVARLVEIGRRLEARNAPLRDRLRQERQRYAAGLRERLARLSREERREEIRRMRDEARRRELPAAIQPVVAEMRRNLAESRREAQGVLTPAQKARARGLLRERREERRERRGREERHPRRPPVRP